MRSPKKTLEPKNIKPVLEERKSQKENKSLKIYNDMSREMLNTASGQPSFRSKMPQKSYEEAMSKIQRYEAKISKYISSNFLRFSKTIGIVGHLEKILEGQRLALAHDFPDFDLNLAFKKIDRHKRGKADVNDITLTLEKIVGP